MCSVVSALRNNFGILSKTKSDFSIELVIIEQNYRIIDVAM